MSSKSVAPAAILPLSNSDIADVFEQVADLLAVQKSNPYRVRAYQKAALTIRTLDCPVRELLQREGVAGLKQLPGIGDSLSASIAELLSTGKLRLLERLLKEVSPEALFATVPGIGDKLSHRLHRQLGLKTLEELELAAHQGKLEKLRGFGPRRIRLVRDALQARLSLAARRRSRIRRWQEVHADVTRPPRPSIELLLEVDARYRHLATEGKLTTIAPRRFNPSGQSWLPIMHLEKEGWSLTALYSNTARAHELGKNHDWVIIYYESNGYEDLCTVVTETRGRLAGQRVVRGREAECARIQMLN